MLAPWCATSSLLPYVLLGHAGALQLQEGHLPPGSTRDIGEDASLLVSQAFGHCFELTRKAHERVRGLWNCHDLGI
jgi:hypothetical protein